MREISSLIYNASEEQVIRARNQLKASILFSQDGPGGWCLHIRGSQPTFKFVLMDICSPNVCLVL